MDTLYANVAQVKATREQIMLLLGTSHLQPADQDELRVALKKQIILSPTAAKRLSILLDQAIQAYESDFGSLETKTVLGDRLMPTPPMRTPRFKSAQATEKVDLCFQLLDRLDIQPAFERSIKIKEKTILPNRFLLGFEKDLIEPSPEEKVLEICEKIGMPPDLLATFMKNLPEANIIGFGFGENETTCIVKAYLEFGIRYYRALRDKPVDPDPYLSHLGCKWDVSDSTKSVVTKYTCYPKHSTNEIMKRLSKGPYRDKKKTPGDIVKGVLDLASSKMGDDQFLFLSVGEENNPRNSFDINMYRANIQVSDVYSLLQDMGRFYAIPDEQFDEAFEPVKSQIFGHIAGGIDRKGKGFFTVYCGE